MEETFDNVNPSEPFTIVVDHQAPSIAQMAVGAAVGLAFAAVSALALNVLNRGIERRNAKVDAKRMIKAGIVPEFPQEDPATETK